MKPGMFFMLALTLAISPLTQAQTQDGSAVLLPLEAQTCKLPSAPSKIPPDADYETLVTGKSRIDAFQKDLEAYRSCLGSNRQTEQLTDGNRLALDRAHDYSVEMETRIAEQFNVAVRAYKARQGQQEQSQQP